MREILFRGKDDNGKWHYSMTIGEAAVRNGEITHYYFGACPTCAISAKTVGQYTGLTDKNGTKVFEGDILNGVEYPFLRGNCHNYFAIIEWCQYCAAFLIRTHKNPLSAVIGICHGRVEKIEEWESSDWEVIGNIHDNPELLEVSE